MNMNQILATKYVKMFCTKIHAKFFEKSSLYLQDSLVLAQYSSIASVQFPEYCTETSLNTLYAQ